MKAKHIAIAGVTVVVLLSGVAVTMAARRSNPGAASDEVPLSKVQRGEVDLQVYTDGDLRANRSKMLTAPPVGGASLQITRLVHTGTQVKKGDVVVEFDPSEQRYKVEQSRSELLQAEQEIIKAKADAAVQKAEDDVALLKARFDVRKAELEVQKNELVSTIDAKKNQLALDQAKRALAELEQDIKSHSVTGRAAIDLAREKWNKAKLSMDQAQENIKKMRVVSPIDGLVAIQKNLDSTGDMFFDGMSVPDFHEGDQARPGAPVAQVIDSSELEVAAQVSEVERANIHVGQPAEIEFDALRGKSFHGKITSAASSSQRQFWQAESRSKYEISVQLTDSDPRLRPGLSAQIRIIGDKKRNALYIPRQALFQKDGKQIVYLKRASGYEQLAVKVDSENESRAAIEGLKDGDAVALIDPTAARSSSSKSAQANGGVL
jgi:multidrug resistance efflux pump